jgi:hypothetical protein
MTRIHSARRNQLVHAGFIITGYSQDEHDRVNYEVDVTITDPKGKLVMERRPHATSRRQVVGKPGLLLADQILDLMVEEGDPLGRYTIRAVVRDEIAHREASAVEVLNVSE